MWRTENTGSEVGNSVFARSTCVTTSPRRAPDGHCLRRSGRTLQFATRVSFEFDAKLRRIVRQAGRAFPREAALATGIGGPQTHLGERDREERTHSERAGSED